MPGRCFVFIFSNRSFWLVQLLDQVSKNPLPHLLSFLKHPLLGKGVAHLQICSHHVLRENKNCGWGHITFWKENRSKAEVTWHFEEKKNCGWGHLQTRRLGHFPVFCLQSLRPQSGDLNKHSNLLLSPQFLLGLDRYSLGSWTPLLGNYSLLKPIPEPICFLFMVQFEVQEWPHYNNILAQTFLLWPLLTLSKSTLRKNTLSESTCYVWWRTGKNCCFKSNWKGSNAALMFTAQE